MPDDDDFRIRPGRIRSSRVQRARPFIAQALAAAQRAGGHVSRNGSIVSRRHSRFGRGRVASLRANRFISSRSRFCTVKARVVRHKGLSSPLVRHLNYLRRDGVTRDDEKGRLFGAETDTVNARDFAERCKDDRHHFRFIVSPEDAVDMADLRQFTRELMAQTEKDLGTKLDWAAVDHWNTDNPHVHVIVRGRADDGRDLVIDRDYIKRGLRDRAQDLITQELGPRTDRDIRRFLDRQVQAERWNVLDRQLLRDANIHGVIDVAPALDRAADDYLPYKVGRLRKLEALGLAEQLGPGQWTISEDAPSTLRALSERGDIIKRIHRALAEQNIERAAADYVLAGEKLDQPVIGRLLGHGLHDDFHGTAFAVIDGLDGRTHHIKLSDLDAAADSPHASIVELRQFTDAKGSRRVAIAVRSDLSIAEQIKADGATWIDRQLISREPLQLGGGFGAEVRAAMAARTEHLVEQGLAQRRGDQFSFNRNLVFTLRQREVDAQGARLAAETGMAFRKAVAGEFVAGTYRERVVLASGRFAMIDDGLGFSLVPWTPSLERHLGRHVSGVARPDGGVDWSFGRKRSLGL
jgi:type IV secretory pathway VirD2 relaxase